MAWSSILDQDRVVETLRRALSQDRVAHAYLFHGPEGVGKRAVALEMARALQCTEQTEEACGDCQACRKTGRMVHPDVHVHLPHPWSEEADRDEEDIGKRIQRLGDNPYAAVDFVRRPSLSDPTETSNKQVLYRIEQVRQDLIKPMSLARGEGQYKVNILMDVEKMREEAANAFLKLLEEPPPQTIFLLTTSRPEQLLPTILSRCQRLRFDPLLPESIESALVERNEMAPDAAAMLSRMADGSYSHALDLARNEALMTSRERVLDYFRAAYTQKVESLTGCIQTLSNQGREQVKIVLQLMLRWVRDLLLYRSMGEEAPLVNVDQKEAVARFCKNLPDADLKGMVGLVEEAIYLTERNVQVSLVLTALAQSLGKAMRGGTVDSLYVPLPEAELRTA
ncbi:DNA polymerase III subunit delta' [Salinibacter sp. 10B]|uniref:DNA polymerase III subunit delta' n=1 Tax=Salinibacter sp. 10B TaxID=1923971 RepID=UPI000CF3CEC5|nr:DNA polymerase III subunit delta' [Salinibacter sp. 10B]PQJ36053.1 DNA polymerase III subunit delta' [Salinibacter sp. 10B]